MHETNPITGTLNHYFGQFAIQVLHFFHQQPYDPQHPITEGFAMELLVFAILLLFFLAVRVSLSVEKPGPIQQTAEMFHGFVSDQADSIIGHGYQRYVMFITCVALFILLGNLVGMVPGLVAPTAKPTVPLGVALVCFFYYHYHGLREQGLIGYIKHFLGPIWWISWMMLPIEIDFPPGARAVAHRPSVCQHVRRRDGHAGVLFAHPGGYSQSSSWDCTSSLP